MAGGSVLSASVGAGGANQAPDVGLVQILLNVMRGMQDKTLLAVDGIPGPLTIAAIREFQSFGWASRDWANFLRHSALFLLRRGSTQGSLGTCCVTPWAISSVVSRPCFGLGPHRLLSGRLNHLPLDRLLHPKRYPMFDAVSRNV
jgi:hypothetical protein